MATCAACKRDLADAAPPAVRAQLASSEHDPFHCATCGQPLTQWARERGFRHCSRTCRTAS